MIETLRTLTGIADLVYQEKVQSLWSGYGEIARYTSASKQLNLVVKQATPPTSRHHPRGWNSDLSHQRKLHSYQVESYFYQHYASLCPQACRLPEAISVHQDQEQFLMILEDIDEAGFPLRFTQITTPHVQACLHWLAHFHAHFLHHAVTGLWQTGTYWHLKTRPDELSAMPDTPLKAYAEKIDATLNNAQFKTWVHGDAKLANFCFSDKPELVAAVDFQYVGGGVGVKDVMLFLGSCLDPEQLHLHYDNHLTFYFQQLQNALIANSSNIDAVALETEWRGLLPFVWADFHRFLAGWSPNHFKINDFMQTQTQTALRLLRED